MTYIYNASGNLVSVQKNGEVIKSYTYGDASWKDLLTAFNGQTITYDEIGNPLQYRDGMSFTWDKGRQLQSVTKNGVTTSYTYDENGLRLSKTTGGVTTKIYRTNGQMVGMNSSDGKDLMFLLDGSGNVYGLHYDHYSSETQTAAATYYFAYNAQGDVIGIYDASGTVVATYAYDEWGNCTVQVLAADANGHAADSPDHIAQVNPFRYRGYFYDGETGFYYLNSRYYDPETGRFVNADSVVDNRGLTTPNLFQYCANNPVNFADFNGHLFGAVLVIGLLTIGMLMLSGCDNTGSTASTSSVATPSIPSTSPSKPTPVPQGAKKFVAVVAGEAIGANTKTRKAVAHTIMNRLNDPKDVWSNVTCIDDVLIKEQYSSVNGSQYNQAMEYLNNRDGSNSTYETLIEEIMPIYYGEEPDFTGGAHYIFNPSTSAGASLEAQLAAQPNRYVKCGPFDGIDDEKYRMYRCLW